MITLPKEFKILPLDETTPAKHLQLVEVLETYLDQVKDFKAVSKLHGLFYKPVPKDSPNCLNRRHQDLALTPFRFYIGESYGQLDFNFSDSREAHNYNDRFSFKISEKSIPAIIEGLALKKKQLQNWLDTFNEKDSYYFHNFDTTIEQNFQQEMTLERFENTKKAIIDCLLGKIEEIKNLKAPKIKKVKAS